MRLEVLLVDVPRVDTEHHQHLASVLDGKSVNDLAPPLLHYHVQQGDPQMVANTAVSDNLVSEYDQTQIVDILAVILLDVDPVHVHENVPDHHHAGLVVVPGTVQDL